MTWNRKGTHVREGDLAQLVGLTHKDYIVRMETGGELQTHRGVIQHDQIIGLPWGSYITSHLGRPFFVLQPTLADLLKSIPRSTQILYAKDIGLILVTMGIGSGMHVVEAGSGSGALTAALAYAVGQEGRVTSYEARLDMHNLARKNLERYGLHEPVTLKLQDIQDGFDEHDVDALFLDLPNPQDYLEQVRQCLKMGGNFGCILPTTNQVTRLLNALKRNGFTFIDVCEVSLRYYKSDAERFRPVDRMVAHTGYLIFARLVSAPVTDELVSGREFEEGSEQEGGDDVGL